jgi:hypothetical protein
MAVEIELDLNAAGATGKIGAVAASLKGLERVADDIDIDFDADIGNITDEIEAFSEALKGVDVDMDNLAGDLKQAAKELDGAEVSVVPDSPDGSTNTGDSTGSDPPSGLVHKLSDFGDVDTSTASATDGGERANLLERTYGEHTLMSNSDVGDLFKTRNSRTSNLGENAPGFTPSDMMQRLGTRTGFGLDPESMNLKRMDFQEGLSDDFPGTVEQMGGELSMEDFARGADPSHGSDMPRVDTLEDRIREFKQHSVNMVDGFSELMEKRDEAAAPIDTPFGDNGLNYDKRMSELTTEELNDLMENPTQSGDGFMGGGGDGGLLDYDSIGEDLRERRESLRAEVEDGVGGYDFTDFNVEARKQAGLSAAELEPEMGGGFSTPSDNRGNAPGLGFSVGGSRSGRSNSDIIDGNSFLSKLDGIESKADGFSALGDSTDALGGKLRKLKPTMGKYMQLMAALLPVAVALGTQLLGVAAAMGSVAAAGGAIVGLGLLGHAESLSGSVAEAKQQMRGLKQEMFQTFQPTMQQFAPIQAQMFDSAPEGLEPVAEAMEGLTVYEDTLYELGSALAGGMTEAVNIIVENEAAISDLTTTFGGLIGSGLLNFFEWLIQAASKNQELLIGLGKDMLKLAVAAYNVSMAVAKVLTAFTPLFNLLVFISEVLNSEIIIGLIAMVGWLFVLGKAAGMIYALYAGFMTLASGIADAALMMFGYEMSTWGAVAATLALVAAIGLLTLGAATVIGGAVTAGAMGASGVPSGPGGGGGGGVGGPGGGGQMVYNDNRSYEINSGGGDDYASQKAMEDTVTRVNETNDAQSLPDVETSSENSDTPPEDSN